MIDYSHLPNPLDKFYEHEAACPDQVFLKQPRDGKWYTYTWQEVGEEARKLAGVFKGLGLAAGSHIAILSKNCASWIIADLAISMGGYVSVPLYPNLSAESLNQILEHSESQLLLVGKLDEWETQQKGVPSSVKCLSFTQFGPTAGIDQWTDFAKKHPPIQGSPKRANSELATIIYTSGTTGEPKGVMHPYQSFSCIGQKAMEVINPPKGSRFFSYLPLCHIAERVLVEGGALFSGGEISFAESLDTFAKNLQTASPTIFLGVPRIWTKFQMGILEKLPQKKLDRLLKIPLISSFIKHKIKKALGLHKVQYCFTGAAPTPVSLIKWFEKLDINILEAYAMTENCCYSHINLPNASKPGWVGQPLPGNEVKLSDEGEVMVKNPSLMTGYFKNPSETARTLVDGFLKTGDCGEIDEQGFLKITGRVKEIFKTEKGKYVAPNPIEMKLSVNNYVEQVCVCGSNIPQPLALIVLSEDAKKEDSSIVQQSLLETMKQVNPTLDRNERLQSLVITSEEWTIENGMLTPTLKIKRHSIEARYSNEFQNWYQTPEDIVWEQTKTS